MMQRTSQFDTIKQNCWRDDKKTVLDQNSTAGSTILYVLYIVRTLSQRCNFTSLWTKVALQVSPAEEQQHFLKCGVGLRKDDNLLSAPASRKDQDVQS